MSRRLRIWLLIWLCAGGWFLWQRGCAPDLDDIVIDESAVTVRNQSEGEWRDVRIWVNDQYVGTARVIAPGGFVREQLSRFVAAQGQRFHPDTPVRSVVLLAKTPAGASVRIVWGKPQWH
jgi:hypothetical protein